MKKGDAVVFAIGASSPQWGVIAKKRKDEFTIDGSVWYADGWVIRVFDPPIAKVSDLLKTKYRKTMIVNRIEISSVGLGWVYIDESGNSHIREENIESVNGKLIGEEDHNEQTGKFSIEGLRDTLQKDMERIQELINAIDKYLGR